MTASGMWHFALTALILSVGSAPAAAADASAWDQDVRSGLRLIAGDGSRPAADGALRAGAEIKLAPGWKTYWRYPGDTGVPPRFDFSESTNVKSVSVLWPAPHRFRDGGGDSIGYKEHVIFPLHVIPQDPSKPVTLRISAEYGICEKLCVPVQTKAELAFDGGPSSEDAALVAAEAQVPVPGAVGEDAAFAIRSVRKEAGPSGPRVVVDVAAPAGVAVDLFAEGPTAEWALPLPAPAPGGTAQAQRFTFDLDGAPRGVATEGAELTLTAVAGARAVEVKARLD